MKRGYDPSSKPNEVRHIDPIEEMKSAVGKVVLVKLRDGKEYTGKLEAINKDMDIILKDCVRVDDGTKYHRMAVRGNNVFFIDIDYEAKQG